MRASALSLFGFTVQCRAIVPIASENDLDIRSTLRRRTQNSKLDDALVPKVDAVLGACPISNGLDLYLPSAETRGARTRKPIPGADRIVSEESRGTATSAAVRADQRDDSQSKAD